jgi:sugar phosphate isomerase/epimerase
MVRLAVGSWFVSKGDPASGAVPPAPEALARTRALGFTGIEVPLERLEARHDAARAARDWRIALETAGLAPSALRVELTADDESSAGTPLAAAGALGVRTLIASGGESSAGADGSSEREAITGAVACWQAVARRALGARLRIGWMSHAGQPFGTLGQVRRVLRGVDLPNFGVVFDPAEAARFVDADGQDATHRALAALDALKGWIAAVRFGGAPDDDSIDLERLIPALLDAGVPDPWWTIDLGEQPDTSTRLEPAAAALLRTLARFEPTP